jgi:hypothetical protein
MTGLQNSQNPDHCDYDWRNFALLVRQRLQDDGRGYRALAHVIGVTPTDLSRAASGHVLAAHKVIAICDWMQVAIRAFYISPTISNCCSGSTVKQLAGAND